MTPYTAVTATVADTETSFETYSRTVLFSDTVAVSLGCQMTTEKLENMFCSLKTANFIWPALHIWHVFLQWPFRIVKIKYAVFRPRKITVFHCSALLIWQLSRMVARDLGRPPDSLPLQAAAAAAAKAPETQRQRLLDTLPLYTGTFTCNDHRSITVSDISIYETGLQRYGLETVV